MPKKTKRLQKISKASQDDPFTIRSDHGSRVLFGPMSAYEEEQYIKAEFSKSTRTDYGRAIDIRIPHGYHSQVRKSWEMYESDRLFKYLVDRCVDFGANGSEWEVPLAIKGGFWRNLLSNVKGNREILKEAAKEKTVWDTWAAKLNQGVSNIIPGIDEINKWIIKHFQLRRDDSIRMEWGKTKIEGVEYELPLKMTSHNTLSVVLDRSNQKFLKEAVYLKISKAQKKILEGNKMLNQAAGGGVFLKTGDWNQLKLLGENGTARQEAFVLKYNWSPGDNTSLVYGKSVSVGQGLYPTPPFVGLYEVLMLRRALCAADLAILDGIVHFIIDWSIGNDAKDADGNLVNQPRPEKKNASGTVIEKSSIQMAKECITSDTRGAVMQLFHPYYIKPEILMPDVKSLISADKYIQTIIEMFLAFGILISPPRTRLDFGDINMANFEELLESMRQRHIKRFWEMLCTEIVRRNKGKLTVIPNLIFNPLNTKDETFRNGLLSLAKIGRVSTGRLLKAFGADERIELRELAREIASGEKAIFDAAVPVSFRQTVVGSKKKKTKEEMSEITPLEQQGRPKKGQEDEEE